MRRGHLHHDVAFHAGCRLAHGGDKRGPGFRRGGSIHDPRPGVGEHLDPPFARATVSCTGEFHPPCDGPTGAEEDAAGMPRGGGELGDGLPQGFVRSTAQDLHVTQIFCRLVHLPDMPLEVFVEPFGEEEDAPSAIPGAVEPCEGQEAVQGRWIDSLEGRGEKVRPHHRGGNGMGGSEVGDGDEDREGLGGPG